MSLANAIRAFTYNNVIVPQLTANSVASFTAGEIHSQMGLQDRIPAVCAALDTKLFEDEYALRLVERLGRPVSTRTRFIFTSLESENNDVSKLTPEHRVRLKWFEEHTGETVAWSSISSPDFRLASLPKGIYRPAGWKYALSIKIMLSGKYHDKEAELADGILQLRYNQEEPRDADPSQHFTNRGLKNCLIDKVPVGIVRQVTPPPRPQYKIVGLGRVVDWSDGYFTLNVTGLENALPPARLVEPISMNDARRRTLRSIVARRGQAGFRQALMLAYGARCAISACNVSEVLEAAHIKPYLGEHTNVVPNGILLRADLHTLFDLRLIRVEPSSLTVLVDKTIRNSIYGEFHGRTLNTPLNKSEWPAFDSLEFIWSQTQTGVPDL